MDVLNPLNFNGTRRLSLFDFKRPFVFNPYWEEVWRVKGKLLDGWDGIQGTQRI